MLPTMGTLFNMYFVIYQPIISRIPSLNIICEGTYCSAWSDLCHIYVTILTFDPRRSVGIVKYLWYDLRVRYIHLKGFVPKMIAKHV